MAPTGSLLANPRVSTPTPTLQAPRALTNMAPVDERIRARLLVLAPGEHEYGLILAAPFVLEAVVRGLQALVVVAVVLVLEGAEERSRAGQEVARFAGVVERDVSAD